MDIFDNARSQNAYWSTVGGPRQERVQEAAQAATEGPQDYLAAGFRATTLNDLMEYSEAFNVGQQTADPTYSPTAEWDQLTADIDPAWHEDLLNARSAEEAQAIRSRALSKAEDARMVARGGGAAMVMYGAGSMFDLDIPVALLSDGGWTAAKVARAVKNTRAASALGTSLSSGASTAAFMTLQKQVNPELTYEDVMHGTLLTMGMGMGIGAVSTSATRAALQRNAMEMDETLAKRVREDDPELDIDGDTIDDYAPMPSRTTSAKMQSAQQEARGVGAAANPDATAERYDLVEELVNKEQAQIIDEAAVDAQKLGVDFKVQERPYKHLDRADALVGGIISDFDKLSKSKANTVRVFRNLFLSNPSGRGGRSKFGNAALMREQYEQRMMQGMRGYYDNMALWMRANQPDIEVKYFKDQVNTIRNHFSDTRREAFNRELVLEMDYRSRNNGASRTTDPHLKAAADALDVQSADALGMQVRAGVRGASDIPVRSGYLPRVHRARAILKTIQTPGGYKRLVGLYAKAYTEATGVAPEIANKVAKAIVNRAKNREAGIDMSLVNMLSADGRNALRDALIANGVKHDEAHKMVEMLSGSILERGKASHLKGRVELDLTTEHEGLRLIDFVETNVSHLWEGYSRKASGQAALAHFGLRSKDEVTAFRDAMIAEQQAIGEEAFDKAYLDEIFSYFEGGPVAGGVSTTVSNLKKSTNLAFLSKMGLTQAGETGALIAALGWEGMATHSPMLRRLVRNAKEGNTDELYDEIRGWTGDLANEHRLFDVGNDYSTDRMNVAHEGGFFKGLNQMLGKGMKVQGYVSGFYAMKQWQTKLGMVTYADKAMRWVRDNDAKGLARLKDAGLDEDMIYYIRQQQQTGRVVFDQHGTTHKLGLDDWPDDIRDRFTMSIHQFVHSHVQKELIGEGTTWMHKDVGSLATHLIRFPLLAYQKQFTRNARLGRENMLMMTMYTLGTAGAAYVAKQMAEGKTDRLDPMSITKAALSMSNMWGWLPPGMDAASNLTGIDALSFNGEYRRHQSPSIPVLGWVGNAMQVPGSMAKLLTGNGDKQDAKNIRALPIIGSMYGSHRFFSALTE